MATDTSHGRLHRLNEISLKQLASLDRDKTVVMLPVGMQEIHGPHLPIGTDCFAVEAVATAAAAWLLDDNPDLHVLLLPTIPYGTDPVDLRRPDLFERSGSVWVSKETLKAIVHDVAERIVKYGFRFVFPIGFHGGADQSRVLASVCEDLRGSYDKLIMYEPMGYVMAGAELKVSPGLATLLGRPLTPAEEVVLRGSIHASMFETSMMLSLHPDLVDPEYTKLRTIEWHKLFKMEDWPGYVGAGPSHANPEIGGAVVRWRGVRVGALIKRAMGGEDIAKLRRHPEWDEEQPLTDAGHDMGQPADPLGTVAAPSRESTPKSAEVATKPMPPRRRLGTGTLEKADDEEGLDETEKKAAPDGSKSEKKPDRPKKKDD